MRIQYFLVFALIQAILFDNACNGQFHWAKHGSDNSRTRELHRALLQYLTRSPDRRADWNDQVIIVL